MIVGVKYINCSEAFGAPVRNSPKRPATDGGEPAARFFSVLRKARI